MKNELIEMDIKKDVEEKPIKPWREILDGIEWSDKSFGVDEMPI